MLDSDSKIVLESIREILREGPDDRFRAKLRQAVEDILAGRMSFRELPGYLRPVLRHLAVSYEAQQKHGPLRAVTNLMRY